MSFKHCCSLCKIILAAAVLCVFNGAYADLYQKSITNPVDAQKAAATHNKRGVTYFQDKDYMAALKEFKIAIGINPDSQATAVYYNNLGKVYLIFGEIQKRNNLPKHDADFLNMAKSSFERAIMQDCMKFEYYKNLTDAYELLGISNQKKNFLIKNISVNPYNAIPAAIILNKQGKKDSAVMLLDDFANNNPDLIITDDVKKYLKTIK